MIEAAKVRKMTAKRNGDVLLDNAMRISLYFIFKSEVLRLSCWSKATF